MNLALLFLAGMLLCNCIPHLTAGLRGELFPLPFAKPRGRGNSPPLVNFLWGAFNLFLGLFLFRRYWAAADFYPGALAFMVGFLLIGIFASIHFGRVRQSGLGAAQTLH